MPLPPSVEIKYYGKPQIYCDPMLVVNRNGILNEMEFATSAVLTCNTARTEIMQYAWVQISLLIWLASPCIPKSPLSVHPIAARKGRADLTAIPV